MKKDDGRSLILDSGFVIALFVKKDENHERALTLMEEIEDKSLVTTYFVFQEIYWFVKKESKHLLPKLFKMFQNIVTLKNIDSDHLSDIQEIVNNYIDQDIDLADASLIWLADQLGHGNILALDRKDFSVYRWGRNKIFNNLF